MKRRTGTEPLDLMTNRDRARARRRILGGPEGARKREEIAAALDDTRSWVDPRGYRLSDRLWNARAYDRQQIDNLLRQSIAAGHDPIQTARRLTQFLTPLGASQQTRTPRGGKGLYAARRLARTETTRAFGQATIEAAKRTRFVTLIRWRTSDRYSPAIDHGVCADNVGEYEPDAVPQYPAHPQCRCTLLPVAEDPEAVADQLLQELNAPQSAAVGPQDDATALTATQELLQSSLRLRELGALRAQDYDELVQAINAGELSEADIAEFLDDARRLLVKEAKRNDIGGAVDIAAYRSNPDEVAQVAGRATRQWSAQMTTDERDAVRGYKLQNYGNINRYLRRGETINSSAARVQQEIDHIDAAFAKAGTFDQDVRLYRGLAFNDNYANQLRPAQWRDLTPGQVITDNGFVSTTYKQGGVGFGANIGKAQAGQSRYLLEIYAPKGTKGLTTDWLTDDKQASREGEVMLRRGTSFLVRSIDEVASGQYRVVMEVVGG